MSLIHRRTLAVAGTAAVVLGLGGTAFAVSAATAPSAPTSGQPSTSTAPARPHTVAGKPGKAGRAGKALRRLEHAQIVVRGKDGPVTRTLWRGTVTAVSATSVTVRAADGRSQVFTVTKDTVVKQRVKGAKATDSSMSTIAQGDHVAVGGTGTPTPTAKRVVEFAK